MPYFVISNSDGDTTVRLLHRVREDMDFLPA